MQLARPLYYFLGFIATLPLASLLLTLLRIPLGIYPIAVSGWVVFVLLLLLVLTLGIWLGCIIDAIGHPSFNTSTKVLWALALACIGFLAMPTYWFVHIKRRLA